MNEEDLVFVDRWATCMTVGCWNYTKPIHILVPVGGDVGCGVCGELTTNITDIKPEEGTVLPEWILQMLQKQNSTS